MHFETFILATHEGRFCLISLLDITVYSADGFRLYILHYYSDRTMKFYIKQKHRIITFPLLPDFYFAGIKIKNLMVHKPF